MMRLAMVLQNQAPTTLTKYICNLAETVLFDIADGLTLTELVKAINEQFYLSFTEDEVKVALKKKADKRIYFQSNNYALMEKTRKTLEKVTNPLEKLNEFITAFFSMYKTQYSVTEFSELIQRYFYFSFNSNKDNLLFLLKLEDSQSSRSTFDASNEEILILNKFLMWDNHEKNVLVYTLISICYEYCMLTVKKDRIASAELFRGKEFFLDANIIFRMAGINNEERKFATKKFIEHCRAVGVKLSCTSNTLDEVYRVLVNQIENLRRINHKDVPISCDILQKMNPYWEANSFYALYCDWCDEPENTVGDFTSFHQKLLSLVQDVLDILNIKNSTPLRSTESLLEFDTQTESLMSFKTQKKKHRYISKKSVETDVKNILDVLCWRSKAGTSIWQTNEFIVSADHSLISWATKTYPGVPLVVLPSVWLSMMLRFTGRTDDDYKSFCLFLTQRQHISNNSAIDPSQILSGLQSRTNNKEIKEKIVVELVQNKNSYSFESSTDYDESLELAFDKIMLEYYERSDQEIQDTKKYVEMTLKKQVQDSKEYALELAKIESINERSKTINVLAKQRAAEKVKVWKRLANFQWIFYFLLFGVLGSTFIIWLFELQPLYSFVVDRIPSKLFDIEIFDFVSGSLTLIVGLLVTACTQLIKYLASPEHELKIEEKYRKKYTSEASNNEEGF